MLRHTLATLAYRAAKALRGAPPGFASFRASPDGRSAGEIVAHMGDLMEWAITLAEEREGWPGSTPQAWDADVARFFGALARLDACLARPDVEARVGQRLFQAPIADALTHVGQLAMMRRLAGSPIRAEDFSRAEISAGRVGLDQAPPVVEL